MLDGYIFNVSIQDNVYFNSLEEAEKAIAALVALGFSDVTLKLEPLFGEKAELFGVRF